MTVDLTQLGANFEPYQQKIAATLKPTILMKLAPSDELSPWQSKVGGIPYLPQGTVYPNNADGVPLSLLAQINFAELPENDVYPKQGIVQFYIDIHDDLMGINFDDQRDQTGFKVLYFEHVIQDPAQLITPEIILDDDTSSPVNGQYCIAFEMSAQYISLADQQFAPKLLGVEDLYSYEDQFEGEGDFYEDFLDVYEQNVSQAGHRLGGYPYFTQSDPRYTEEMADYVLLLQLDSEENQHVSILWGDLGVGNFFIHPEDLKNKDFSKVLYNWDCH